MIRIARPIKEWHSGELCPTMQAPSYDLRITRGGNETKSEPIGSPVCPHVACGGRIDCKFEKVRTESGIIIRALGELAIGIQKLTAK